MQPSHSRAMLRWIHLSAAVFIGVSTYSPWRSEPMFATALKYVVFPLLSLTGLVRWQQARLLRRRDSSPSAAGGRQA